MQVRARYQFPSGSKKRVQLKLHFQKAPGAETPPMGQGQPAPRHAPEPTPLHDHRDWLERTAVYQRSQELLDQLSFGIVMDLADLTTKQQRVVSVVVLDEEAR